MKKLLLTLAATIIAYTQSNAQIVYHDINPDTTVNTWNAFIITPLPGNTTDNITIWWHPTPEVVIQTWGNCELLFDAAGNLPLKLNMNDTITASGKWKVGNYHALNSAGTGNWQTNATDKYLGFRIKNGSSWYYGWVKMTVTSGAASFTVKEWAYNPSGSIKAGQTTTTGINSVAGSNNIALYPNPAKNQIQLQYTPKENLTIHITDLQGKNIRNINISKGTVNPVIDINELSPGMYRITTGDITENLNATFVKQ